MALASLAAAASLLPAAAARSRVSLARCRGMASSSSPSAAAGASAAARVGVVQMTSVGDLDANYATCSRLAKEAASSGVKFLCFPEVFSFIGSKDGESIKIAEPLDGPIMQRYCSLAKLVRTNLLNFHFAITYKCLFIGTPFLNLLYLLEFTLYDILNLSI
jgi:hypothetical protein